MEMQVNMSYLSGGVDVGSTASSSGLCSGTTAAASAGGASPSREGVTRSGGVAAARRSSGQPEQVCSREDLAPYAEALRAGMARGLKYKALSSLLFRDHGVKVKGVDSQLDGCGG